MLLVNLLMNSRNETVGVEHDRFVGVASGMTHPLLKTAKSPPFSMSTTGGNASRVSNVSLVAGVRANHTTASPSNSAINTQAFGAEKSVQAISPGVPSAIKTVRASSSANRAVEREVPCTTDQPLSA